MAIIARFLQLLALTATVNGTPLRRRGTLPPDQVKGLAEVVPNDNTGTLYEAYQPYLDVINGCVPFPAVDANGNTKYHPPFLSPKRNLIDTSQRRSPHYWFSKQRLQQQPRPNLRPWGSFQRSLRNHVLLVYAQRLAIVRARPPSRMGRRDHLAGLSDLHSILQHPRRVPVSPRKLGLQHHLPDLWIWSFCCVF